MKKITLKKSISIIFLCFSIGLISAQTFCMQMTELSNDGDTSVVSITMQGETSFIIGSSNLQFSFTVGAFGAPTLVSSPLAPPWYQPVTITEPGAGLASINIQLGTSNVSGTIAAVPANTEIAVIKLPILDHALAANGVVWDYNGGTTQTVVFLEDNSTQLFAAMPGCLNGFVPIDVTSLPLCPLLVTPANLAVDIPSDNGVVFEWTNNPAGVPPTSLTFYIGTDPDPINNGTNILLSGVPETVNILGATFETTYYWAIVPSGVSGSAEGCTVWSFTTEDTPPGAMNNTCALANSIGEGIFTDLGPRDGDSATNLCIIGATNSSWYEYTASGTGVATVGSVVDTNLIDTRVSIHSACDTLDCLAFNDDFEPAVSFAAQVSFPVVAGENYFIEWDDRWSGAAFDFEISLILDVDGCTNPLACNYNVDATIDDLTCILPTGCDTCSGETDGTGTLITGLIVGDPCDDGDECTVNDIITVACSCEGIPTVGVPGCIDVAACNFDSAVNKDDGSCIYAIGCDTCSGETDGTGTVVDNPEVGDVCDDGDPLTTGETMGADCVCAVLNGVDCSTALNAFDGVQTAAGTLAIGGTASNTCFTGGTSAVWFAYVATSTDTIVVSSSIDLDEPDTRVSIYNDCDSLICAGGDDDSGEGFSSIAFFTAVAGETYYIEWDDRWDDGEFDFEIRPRIAGCSDPIACNYNQFSEVSVNTCIYADSLTCDACSGEIDGTGTVIDNPENGELCDDGDVQTSDDMIANCICMGVIIDVLGCDDPLACNYNSATTEPVIACIYLNPLSCDSCSGEIDGTGIVVDLPEAGDACDDVDLNTGNDIVQADCTCAGFIGPGADCASATPVTDGITLNADIIGGSGATNACFNGATNALWFVYTAPCTGFATVSSSIDLDEPDTRVSVHSDCANFDCIASDDDGGAGLTSLVTFDVVAGEDYYIEWDDRWDDGVFDFEISFETIFLGCTDPAACNFNVAVNADDGSCIYAAGCDTCSGETNGTGTVVDNPEIGEACDDNGFEGIVIGGCICSCSCIPACTDATACNYNDDPLIGTDNTICIYAVGCDTCSGQTDGTGVVVDNPEIGESCDDGDVTTLNDIVQANCMCQGVIVPGGPVSCSGAIVVTDGITTSLGTDTIGGGGASDSCFTGGINSIWYVYTALVCDTVTITSQVDSIDLPDTRVSIHSDCATLDCIASDDDSGSGFTSFVQFLAVAGEDYYIEWDDRWDGGVFDFEISTPTDSCPTNFDDTGSSAGVTDGVDFSFFLGNFGLVCVDLCDCPSDLNKDGTTNGDDFGIFLGNFGLDCPSDD